MQAVVSGAQAIKLGEADVILAGGVESMSTVPYTIDALRWGARFKSIEVHDAMWDGLNCLGVWPAMGITAENLAQKYNISRKEQDEFAYLSHQKTVSANKEKKFEEEILPIKVSQGRATEKVVDTDEHPRADTTLEALSKLRPAFKEGGTVCYSREFLRYQ
jgi:acetyl-CoA C-acetyltransferase